MTPEQLMEIPGIGEKMVDKIYQAVNQFYESGGTAAEGSSETGEAAEGEVAPESEVAAEAESEIAAPETTEGQSAEAETSETAGAESRVSQPEEASANEQVQTELPPEAAGAPDEVPDANMVSEKHEEKSSE
jgi:DNA mismatch repair ATPase MutL